MAEANKTPQGESQKEVPCWKKPIDCLIPEDDDPVANRESPILFSVCYRAPQLSLVVIIMILVCI
jgi:hypothetical protein